MRISITGRRVEVTPALREYAEEKVSKLNRFLENVIEVNITLSIEKYRNIAEVFIQGDGLTITGEEETNDMYSAIDKVMDKIEKQVRRLKEKRTDLRHSPRAHSMKYSARDIESSPPEHPVEKGQIIKTDRYWAKPMSVDEAAMQLDILKQEFIVFRNSTTNEINVIYRRADENYGWIEPA